MTKKTPDTLLAVLNSIASGVVPFTKAAAMADVKPGTFWHWLRQDADPSLMVSWRGESMQFGDAVRAARREALDGRHRVDAPDNIVHHYHHVEVHVIVDREHDEPIARPGKVAEPMGEAHRTAPVAEISLEEMLGEPELVPDELAPELVPDEARIIPDKPEPVAIDATPNREPRSALERDLFDRLAAARAKNVPVPSNDTSATKGPPAGSAMAL